MKRYTLLLVLIAFSLTGNAAEDIHSGSKLLQNCNSYSMLVDGSSNSKIIQGIQGNVKIPYSPYYKGKTYWKSNLQTLKEFPIFKIDYCKDVDCLIIEAIYHKTFIN